VSQPCPDLYKLGIGPATRTPAGICALRVHGRTRNTRPTTYPATYDLFARGHGLPPNHRSLVLHQPCEEEATAGGSNRSRVTSAMPTRFHAFLWRNAMTSWPEQVSGCMPDHVPGRIVDGLMMSTPT